MSNQDPSLTRLIDALESAKARFTGSVSGDRLIIKPKDNNIMHNNNNDTNKFISYQDQLAAREKIRAAANKQTVREYRLPVKPKQEEPSYVQPIIADDKKVVSLEEYRNRKSTGGVKS